MRVSDIHSADAELLEKVAEARGVDIAILQAAYKLGIARGEFCAYEELEKFTDGERLDALVKFKLQQAGRA